MNENSTDKIAICAWCGDGVRLRDRLRKWWLERNGEPLPGISHGGCIKCLNTERKKYKLKPISRWLIYRWL